MGRWAGRRFARLAVTVLVLVVPAAISVHGWGPQGHRLVALVATNHLSPAAREQVKRLLGDDSLADVAVWADGYLTGNNQTSFWHYVSIPLGAARYDRDRHCPRQPGVSAGGRGDSWRDCAVDRIRYNQERVGDRALDRADRAIALKFLVHLPSTAASRRARHSGGPSRTDTGSSGASSGSCTSRCRRDRS